jgi:hypothetical protein
MIDKINLREIGLNEDQIQNFVERLSEETGSGDWEEKSLKSEDPDIVESMYYNSF